MARVHDEVLIILEELGGEVVEPGGAATRLIFERVSCTTNFATVSTAIGDLEKRGLLVRDQPSLKRTTRIALARDGVRPGRKALPVAMEHLSRSMSEAVEATVRDVIEAERQAIHAEFEAQDRAAESNEIANLRSQLQDRTNEVTVLRASLDQVRKERDDALEAQRIAEHNADVWRSKRLRAPELMEQIRDRLSPEERRDLERMMKEMRT